jgi:hypothetical protein
MDGQSQEGEEKKTSIHGARGKHGGDPKTSVLIKLE